MVATVYSRARGLARSVWDAAFGPPAVRVRPDGYLQVRVLGRMFEAKDHESLFTAVSRERERVMQAVANAHAGVLSRSSYSVLRPGVGDVYQRDLRRLEDRLAAYNEFLGHLQRMMPQRSS